MHLPISILPPSARGPVLEAAIEVLRSLEPPELPAWLRKLVTFDPRRLREGRAADELIRGVDQVEEFRTAVLLVIRRRQRRLVAELAADAVAATDRWLAEGGDPGVLGAAALALEDPAAAGWVAGRAAAAAEAAAVSGLVEEIRKGADAARKEAAAGVERWRAEVEAALAARDEVQRKLERAVSELRQLRNAEAERDQSQAAAAVAAESSRASSAARAAAEKEADTQAKARREAERRSARAQREQDRLAARVAELEVAVAEAKEAAGTRHAHLSAAVANVAAALEEASLALRRVAAPGEWSDLRPARAEPVGERRRHAGRQSRPRVDVPPGIDPDTPEGLLASLAPGVTVLVDGYNALLDEEGMAERDWLVRALSGLVRSRRATARVFFDGVVESLHREAGVEVVFTDANTEADDAILADLDTRPSMPAIVVSSDRRVREGARQRGAEAVASRTLLRALRSRRG